ncbi:F-box protein [Quillaja saponaria]|uniref:F-box protein n=1 Tax=Quillaja saponaria TaxID=32244 RepID=A0AAD7VEY9_QUISA|nr:F-box protein [Quillaja saponaria]
MTNKQIHTFSSKRGQIELRPWHNLPVDILSKIMQLLDGIDLIHLRNVCTSWRQAQGLSFSKKLPCLMGHYWGSYQNGSTLSLCSFHLPSPKLRFIRWNIIGDHEWIVGAGICASKYSWLLLQKLRRSFFYNPFTKDIIQLPDMDIGFNRATFSSAPTSSDCICFALQSVKMSDEIYISICRLGDQNWTTVKMQGFDKVIEDIVYSDSKFYCVFSGGVLGAFHIADRQWSLLTDMEPITGVQFSARAHMVESNGELLLICPCSYEFKIFTYDQSIMSWVQRNSLGDQAIFLGCTSFSVLALQETSDLA